MIANVDEPKLKFGLFLVHRKYSTGETGYHIVFQNGTCGEK